MPYKSKPSVIGEMAKIAAHHYHVANWLEDEIRHFQNEVMEAEMEVDNFRMALDRFKKTGSLPREIRQRYNRFLKKQLTPNMVAW